MSSIDIILSAYIKLECFSYYFCYAASLFFDKTIKKYIKKGVTRCEKDRKHFVISSKITIR